VLFRFTQEKIVVCLVMSMALSMSTLVMAQAQPVPPPAQPVFKQIQVAPIFDANSAAALADKQVLSSVRRNQSLAKSRIVEILQGRSALNDNFTLNEGTPGQIAMTNQQLLAGWYQQYRFALMTQAVTMSDIDTHRMEFLRDLSVICTDNDAHRFVVEQITIPQMRTFISENYHPVVKYNAMLIMGQLNQQVSRTEVGRSVPLPSVSALSYLVETVQADTETDAVLLACWVGILRHVSLNRLNNQIPAEGLRVIAGEAMDLLNQVNPPRNRSQAGQVWLQRRAIDVLAMIGQDNGEILPKLLSIIQDDAAAMPLRLTAARALGLFNYNPTTRVPVEATSTALGVLMVRICRNEIDRVDQEKTLAALLEGAGMTSGMDDGMGGGMPGMGGDMGGGMPGMGGVMGGGMPGMGGGMLDGASSLDPAEKRKVDYSRRRLVYQLFHVVQAIGDAGRTNPPVRPPSGMYLAVTQDAAGQAAFGRVADSMTALIEILRLPETESTGPDVPVGEPDRDALLDSVSDEIRKLESFVIPVEEAVPATTPAAAGADAALPGGLPGS